MSRKLSPAAATIALAGFLLGISTSDTHAANERYPPPFPRKGAVKVLENCRVIVWKVTWLEGQWSAMHRHYRDAVVVTLRGGSVDATTPDGKTNTFTDAAGHVTWSSKGVIHKEVGLTDPPRQAIVIELKPPRADCRL